MRRFLIISDLHAYTPSSANSGRPPSLLTTTRASRTSRDNMIRSVAKMVELEGLKVDVILCPGDLADRADPEGQKFVWEELHKLKKVIGASSVIGTAGNHDVDSRLQYTDFDPKGNLLGLTPPFPGPTNALSDKYWAHNFSIEIRDGVRLLNLNSAAFHGYASEDTIANKSVEYIHGRVSDATIFKMRQELGKRQADVNVLLTHHHIYKNDAVWDDDYSDMTGSGKLLKMLTDTTNSSWLVVHGHQHFPALFYGAGQSFRPIVISAGSASAYTRTKDSSAIPNQVYYLELAEDGEELEGWNPCGVLRGWHWGSGYLWEPSPTAYAIPNLAGFGCHMNASQIADAIVEVLDRNPGGYIVMNDVYNVRPLLRYLLPEQLHSAFKELATRKVKITPTYSLLDTNIRRLD